MQLSLFLFGPFKGTWEDKPLSFATNSTKALLAYLAVEADRPQPRELLATLLWPNQTGTAAHTNLRQTLFRLRKAFPEPSDAAAFLTISPQTIELESNSVTTDLASFENLLAQNAAHPHNSGQTPITCSVCLMRLEEAVNLYRGEFLQGLYLDGSEAFEEWLGFKRQALRHQAIQALQPLIQAFELAGEYVKMAEYAARQLSLDTLQEEAHIVMMRAMALVGDRNAALKQYEICRNLLASELGIEPGTEITTLFEAIRNRTFPPVAPFNPDEAQEQPQLPQPLTAFVGREDEIKSLLALLKQKETRLLTLTGMGGMGKTRLAIELARAATVDFGRNIYFISLASLIDPGSIGSAISTGLGISLSRRDPWQSVLQFFHSKKALLVLDNFEHLMEGGLLIVQLLEASPNLQIVVTSRERLQLQSETVYQLEGLPYNRHLSLEMARQQPAVKLLELSARRVKIKFEVNSANLAAVLQICHLTEGMPLALELAAAWLNTFSIQTIASQIEESAAFLETAWRDLPARQQSMKAIFDWSWRLLTPSEQADYSKLSVFRGAFTLEAAGAVCGVNLPVLLRLVQKSLVQAEADRFELHELIRQFGWEKLTETETGTTPIQIQARHSEYFLDFLSEREGSLRTEGSRQVEAEIEVEIDNIRLAWQWATENLTIPRLEKSVIALWRYYFLSGLQAEGEKAMRTCALCCLEGGTGAPETAESRSRLHLASICLAAQAFFLAQQNYYSQTIEVAKLAVEYGQLSEENFSVASGNLRWGNALFRLGSFQAALPLFSKAVELSRPPYASVELAGRFSDIHWDALLWLARAYIREDAYSEARIIIEECIRFCRNQQILYGELYALLELCSIAEATGDMPRLEKVAGETLELARQLGTLGPQGGASLYLGKVQLSRKAYTQAREFLEHGLGLLRQIGGRLYEAWILIALGQLEFELGNYSEAEVLLKQALGLSRSVGTREAVVDALLGLARVAYNFERPVDARSFSNEGLNLAKEIGDKTRYSQAEEMLAQFSSPKILPGR